MAVTMTTKFYEDHTPDWRDLAKVVYTSPNMATPNTAGTRSHILPGQGDLGMWYEDTTYMYRVAMKQESTSTDYYNYIAICEEYDLDTQPAYITITGTTANYEVYYDYIKEGVGCSPVGYTEITKDPHIEDEIIKVEYTSGNLDYLYTDTVYENTSGGDETKTIANQTFTLNDGDKITEECWAVRVIGSDEECYIDFTFDRPYKITKITFSSFYFADLYDGSGTPVSPATYTRWSIGNYKIEGKLNIEDSWTTLMTVANSTDIDTFLYLSSNDNYFKYYRILITNNDSLDTGTFDNTRYAIRDLKFYKFEYNNTSTRVKPLYAFYPDGSAKIVYVDDIEDIGGGSYKMSVDHVTGSGTIADGHELKSWGTLTGEIDYSTLDSVVFTVTAGEAYNCRLTAWDDVTHSTTSNNLIYNDRVRVSSLAFCATNTVNDPQESFSPLNYVFAPIHNRIFKGNTVYGGTKYYYGDFDLVYRPQSGVIGDLLIFKPYLVVDASIPYGVHDFVIVLHYSYT